MQKTDYRSRALFLGLLFIVYMLAWYAQQNLFLNSDVSWLAETSRRMLAGGTYHKDFFELNPPMILYVYLPAILLQQFFHLPSDLCMRLYIFFLTFLSITACTYLTKYIFNPADSALRGIFLLMLSGLFCFLPVYEFGQRDVLLLILCFPYFLLMNTRLYGCNPNKIIAVMVGLLAGVGFAIKPHFLAVFIIIELYYCYVNRKLGALLRPESLAVLALIAAYITLIALRHQDYLTIIVPFVNQFYYQEMRSPLHILFFNDHVIYFYFSLSLFALFYRRLAYKQLAILLVLAASGFYISYLSQGTYWYYHILPLFAAAIAIFGLIFFSFAHTDEISVRDYIKLILWLSVFGIYLMACMSFIRVILIFYPTVYFGLFAVIFAPLLYLANHERHLVKITCVLLLIFGVNYLFYKNVELSSLNSHAFLLTNLLLILSFILFLPRQFAVKCKYTFFALFGLLLFSYPFYWSAYLYNGSLTFKILYLQLIKEMNNFPNHSVYFLTDSDQFPFPAVFYTHQRFASRFSALSGLPVIRHLDEANEYVQAYKNNQTRIDLFIHDILEDFKEKKPDLIFVDIRRPNKNLHYFANTQLDYIQLFSLNPEFKAAWKNFHYIKTIDGQPLYKFKLFAFGPNAAP